MNINEDNSTFKDNFDFDKIYLVSERKLYKIKYYGKDIVLNTAQFTLPFGFEKYSGKLIMNLEFDVTDNEVYNYITSIKSFDNLFNKIKTNTINKIPEKLKRTIEKSYYVASIKERGNVTKDIKKFHHRCHVKNPASFFICDTKDKKFVAQVKLDHLWVHNETYGLVWYIILLKEIHNN